MLRRNRQHLAGLLAFFCTSPAAAVEYCVSCEGPPALYRCVVEGTPDGPGSDPRATLLCISQMAAKGDHETCAASRGAPFPCPGLTAMVQQGEMPTLATPPTAAAQSLVPPPPASAKNPDPAETQNPEAPQTAEKVPQTMEELAGQSVKSSKEGIAKAGEAIGGTAKKAGEQIGNAGSAIGNAASKTWTCIMSLFNTCGEEKTAD